MKSSSVGALVKCRLVRTCVIALLICMLIVGLTYATFGRWFDEAQRQRRIVARIQSAGGWVLYDFLYGFSAENHGIPGWKGARAPSPILLRLLGPDMCGDVVYVQLTSAKSSNDDFALLVEDLVALPQLQHLLIAKTRLDDRSVVYLMKLKQLRVLDVERGQFSQSALRVLQNANPDCRIWITKNLGQGYQQRESELLQPGKGED